MCAIRKPECNSNANTDRAPRASIVDWLQAWHTVMREPDKEIPELDVPPEGTPLPETLHLRCPECNYNLTGLKEWRCPECGERFNPYRAYTVQMLKTPEGFLRYRFDPRDIRCIFWTAVFVAATLPIIWFVIRGTGFPVMRTTRRMVLEMVICPPAVAVYLAATRNGSLRRLLVIAAVWLVTTSLVMYILM